MTTCSMHVPGCDLCILFLCSPSGLGLVLYSISLRALILAWGPGVCAAVWRGLYLVCLSLNKKDWMLLWMLSVFGDFFFLGGLD